MAPRLYVIAGSHPSRTARLTLEHKDIEYKRVDLIAASAVTRHRAADSER